MAAFQITSLYAGLCALLIAWLTIRIVGMRKSMKVSLSDDGDGGVLHAAVRAHGNAVETIPLCLILIGLIEANGAPGWVVHFLGVSLVLGRLLHASHFMAPDPGIRRRVAGMILTVNVMVMGGLGLVLHALI